MLRFPLLGIPVGIHLSFLLIALFGIGVYEGVELVGWTLGVGLAVLFHEFGHALTARAFGAGGITVTLFALGGFTTWAPGERPVGPGKRFFIAAAGSAVGIALGGAILLAGRSGWLGDLDGLFEVFLESFVFAALLWGIFNWLPILPLDGGQMARSLFELFLSEERALAVTKGLTVVAGVAAAAFVYYRFDSLFGAAWIAIIAFLGLRSVSGSDAEQPKDEEIRGEIEDRGPVEEPDEPPPPFPI